MNKSILWSWGFILGISSVFGIFGALRGMNTFYSTEPYEIEKTVYASPAQKDSIYIHFNYQYPIALATNDSALKAIQRQVQTYVFGEMFADVSPEHSMVACAAIEINNYMQNTAEESRKYENDPSFFSGTFTEVHIVYAAPQGIARGIFSYGEESYTYSGGAHGYTSLLVQNYCIATGRELHEIDLFKEEYVEPLQGLLLDALIAQTEDVENSQDLEQQGFNLRDIVPNDNFYVSEEGLTYVYNPYDIAPYAVGRVEIFLPWSDLADIMR